MYVFADTRRKEKEDQNKLMDEKQEKQLELLGGKEIQICNN